MCHLYSNIGHYEDVVVVIFQYIEMLKKVGVKKWIFDEVQSLAAIEFKFAEKYPPSQYTSFLTQQMQSDYPPEWTISGTSLLRKYDPELITEHLSLLRPDNFRLTLASQEFPFGIKCDKIERWYNTEYNILPLSQKLDTVCVCVCACHVLVLDLILIEIDVGQYHLQ